MLVPRRDGFDISLGAGKPDVLYKHGAVGCCVTFVPFEDVTAAGVVISEGVRERIVGVVITA